MGTLGFHLDGRPCRVGCDFCYLGARRSLDGPTVGERELDPAQVAAIVAGAPARDVAVAVNEPASRWRPGLEAIVAAARARGLGVAITTTPEVVAADPWVVDGATRLTLSVDPAKRGPTFPLGPAAIDPRALAGTAASVARPGLEIVALVSMMSPGFCDALAGGLLGEILAIPALSAVALNGLKPPPPWCDRRFQIGFLARLRPLLDAHLGRRLHLDCYVAARILGLGDCPAKPDVSAGREFRACVYQARPDFVFTDAADFAARTADYRAPAECPFAIT